MNNTNRKDETMRTHKTKLMTVIAAAACILAAVALPVVATEDNTTTNYFAGAVTVLATSTNMGDTGLTLSTDYLAIPLTVLTDVTTGNVTDVRAVMYGIAQGFYLTWTAEDSTNRSASTTARTVSYETSSTNVYENVIHQLNTRRILGTATLP